MATCLFLWFPFGNYTTILCVLFILQNKIIIKNRIGGMKMNAQECLPILREIKDVSFATVDEKGFPQVRIIDVMLIENNKLYFCSARGKDFYKQLKINNHVALCADDKELSNDSL